MALVGRLTKDPELKKLSEGRVQTSFVLAVNRRFRNDRDNDADFVLCTAWGKAAVNTVKYCGKGSLVSIGGRLQSRSYEKGGNRVYVTEVVSEEVRFLATKPPARSTAVAEIPQEDSQERLSGNGSGPYQDTGPEAGVTQDSHHERHGSQAGRGQTLPPGLVFENREEDEQEEPIRP
ncbi:single-stranded DNA-binding protein [Bhargavaea cecembensis]|uniref:single-stranded DNA-binding protein n=1 Tax=Bhargavaea cecembensis TaxID=394098 RepID=UPI001E582214|nr:single-stranded DNA-binding protein [Bhargavaea cecembensis]